MGKISIFDIFKVGVGPSSSHTLGPWKAALHVREQMEAKQPVKVEVHLYGSLSKTGKGHKTDTAIMMGLLGHEPESVDCQQINAYEEQLRKQTRIEFENWSFDFHPARDILFQNEFHEAHPNTFIFLITYEDGTIEDYLCMSLGGGFIKINDQTFGTKRKKEPKYPIDHGFDLIQHARDNKKSIIQIIHANEKSYRNSKEIDRLIRHIYKIMMESVYNGCRAQGFLPGGLNVNRRAKQIFDRHIAPFEYNNIEEWLEYIFSKNYNYQEISALISCFAMAVNEENASMGRIVTSPTNGSAGVIPAVLMYYQFSYKPLKFKELRRFFYVAGEIGCIYKENATISAAQGGCQAEIGVSSSMAAGGLTELLGGSPLQVLMAAEIAMEHHLGLTCDPIGGLVQVPCIERNSMGASKAITAAHLAMSSEPEHAIVNFDSVVKTMWETAKDINERYKETSEGGLAVALPLMLNC